MSLRHGWGASALLLAGLTAAAWSDMARADGGYCPSGGCATGNCATGNCGTGGCATGDCGSSGCCPKYYFTIEKPPKIRFKTVCSKCHRWRLAHCIHHAPKPKRTNTPRKPLEKRT